MMQDDPARISKAVLRWITILGRTLAALALLIGSLAAPGNSAVEAHHKPGHIDVHLRREMVARPNDALPILIQRRNSAAAVDAVRNAGGRIVRSLELGNVIAAEVVGSKIESLTRDPGIIRIAYDAPVVSQAVGDPLSGANLASVYPHAVRSAELWAGEKRITGAGIGVAVIDSGIREHSDFHGDRGTGTRISARVAILPDPTGGPVDEYGHGTWVAGVVGGHGWGAGGKTDDGQYVGIAPNVNLVSIKISDRQGRANISQVIAGIEWAVRNRQAHNIRVINLSVLSTVAESSRTSLLNAAVEWAWLKGIAVVVSAGNGGPNTMLYPPANDPYAIVVGATDDLGTRDVADDARVWFSSHGVTQDGHAKPDLVAPGRRIVAPLANRQAQLAQLYPDRVIGDSYIRLSGTSASAPIVSGVAAQVLQAKPGLRPGQVKWLLQRTARPVPGPGTGAGYPQAAAAVSHGDPIEDANRGLVPNYLIARAGYLTTLPPGANWGTVSWDTVSWDTVSWDTVSWDTVSWDTVSWDTVSWDTVSWDTVSWDTVSWDTVSWD